MLYDWRFKRRGRKPGLETLHFTDGSKIQLPEDHKALHLIQQVRDEAHRFAITRHRAKRDKRRASSVLEAIPGLGPKRRRDLLTHFGGIQGVLKASEKNSPWFRGWVHLWPVPFIRFCTSKLTKSISDS